MMRKKLHRVATSLLTRILLVEALTILAACIALPLLAQSVLQNSVAAVEQDMLRQQAVAVAGALHPVANDEWRVDLAPSLQPIYATGYDGRAYAVLDWSGRVAAASRFALPAIWPAGIRTTAPHHFKAGTLVGLSLPIKYAKTRLWVIVTQDQAQPGAVLDDVVHSFLSRYLVVLVALLLLMPIINGVLLWGSFRRLRKAARDAATIHPRMIGARLDDKRLPGEARTLVQATNELLDRVEAAFHQQDEFAGNVAHELRTPLATLRLQVAALPEGARREALEREIDRISHVLAQLRDLASTENAARAPLMPLDLAELVIAVVADLTPSALTRGHFIAITGGEEPIMVMGNRGLLTMALTNLIDNASLHTPGGTTIEVVLTPDGAVSVQDDGPGIAEIDQPKLARRFWRADHRRSDGAGLGLSIVQRIIEAHRGTLGIDASPLGGARFTMRLPLA